jgi:hypothetical protein
MTAAETRTDVHPRIHGSFVIGVSGRTSGIDLGAALRATAHANAICEPRLVTPKTTTERPSL